jgi:hypothetical protein
MQGIEIPIGAPLGQLDKDLKGAESKLKGFAAEASKTAGVLGGATVKGANSAAFAMQNLGRVAQDAPFGFIGIQNNLNPLLESFQRLKQESGSTGGALKALGSSLIGPAGLGIALSVVSSAVLFYQQYQQRANKTTNDAKKAADEYITTLGQLQQVQLKGATSAQEELTTLSLLFNQYKDQNSPLENRKAAYEELQKLYPAYFKNLDFESNAAGKTKTAYDLLTVSILANARAKAASDLITKNATRQLENEQKIIDLTTASEEQRAIAAKALIATKAAGGELEEAKALADLTASLGKQREIQSQINNLKTDSNLLTDKNLQLEKSITEQKSKIDPKFNDQIDKENKSLKTQDDILKALAIDKKQIGADLKLLKSGQFIEEAKVIQKAINDLIGIGVKTDSGIIKKLQQDLVGLDQSGLLLTGKQLGLNLIQGVKEGVSDIGGQVGTQMTEDMAEGFARGAPVIAKTIGNSLKLPLTDFQIYVNEQLLPKLQTNFETFFNDILMKGELSFDSLGQAIKALGEAIKNTFLSVLASEATQGVLNLLRTTSGKDFTQSQKGGGAGLLGGIAKAIGIGGAGAAAGVATAGSLAGVAASTGGVILGAPIAAAGTIGLGTAGAAAGATAATGGLLLPVLAGIAAVAGIASLFKKKQQAPIPQASSTISTSAAGSAQDFGGGRVVFEISGTNLIGVLNRAGAKLQRFGP